MSKIPPDLTNMPPHIKQMIVNSSDIETKLCQRALSRDFKCKVERAQISYLKLKMIICPRQVQLFWKKTEGETIEVTFKPSRMGYIMRNDWEDYEKETHGDYRKAAVAKLLSVFKQSKVKVGTLRIREGRGVWPSDQDTSVVFEEFNRILSEKPFRLRVERFRIRFQASQEQILSILPYLEPITLKLFEMNRPPALWHRPETVRFDEIVQTEQWMGLEQVGIYRVKIEMPPERMFHLNEVSIPLPVPPTETIVQILETFLLKPTLELLCLDWPGNRLDTTRAKEYVRRFEKIPELCSSRYDCIRLPYEGNNLVYIRISEYFVEIQRNTPFPNFD